MRVVDNSWPITRNQLKAGRLLANLGIRELGKLAQISPTAINQIETGKTVKPRVQTLTALKEVLQAKGIEFGSGGWVRHCDDQNNRDDGEPGFEAATPDKRIPLIRRKLMHLLDIVRGNVAENDNEPAAPQAATQADAVDVAS